MKTFKLTYIEPTSNFELSSRMIRARDEQHARQIAYEFVEEEFWLDPHVTRCEVFRDEWNDPIIEEPKRGAWF